MQPDIQTINLGGVNCFLLRTTDGFVLVDTGFPNKRADLEKALSEAGCHAGNFKLILITHGDHDHTGNCVYLHEKYNVKIAMHAADAGMVERGDMTWNRNAKPAKLSAFGRAIMFFGGVMNRLSKSAKFETFSPDFTIDENFDLSEIGLDARVILIPGHSKGSIGILTAAGDLICGDLLMNLNRPRVHFLIDDLETYNASLEKLKSLGIKTIYPGHGKPFTMEHFFNPQH